MPAITPCGGNKFTIRETPLLHPWCPARIMDATARSSCRAGPCDCPRSNASEANWRGWIASQPDYASRAVDGLLAAAESAGASDVHLQPTAAGLELKFRVDGVLLPVAVFPAAAGRQHHRPAQGPGRPAHLPYRSPAGRPHPHGRGRRRDAGEHVSHAAGRAGGGAALRRLAALSAARRPRAARRRAGAAPHAAGRNLRGNPRLRAGRQRQDHDALRLPAGIGPADRRPAEPGLDRRPHRSGRRGRGAVAGPPGRRARPGRGPALSHAAGPRGHHGRRNPRPRHRRSGPASLVDRPPRLEHLPRRQRRRDRRPAAGHGRRALRVAERPLGRREPAAAAAAVRLRPGDRRRRRPAWACRSAA